MSFKFRHTLPTKAVTANGNVAVELSGLPLKARIAGFLLEIKGTGTAASSTQAVTPKDMAQFFASIDFDTDYNFTRIDGNGLYVLNRLMSGRTLCGGAQTVTCSTGGEEIRCALYLPFADEHSRKPYDTAIATRLVREKTLNIQFKSTLVLDLTNDVTLSNANQYVTAILVPEDDDRVPTRTRITFLDVAQATGDLPGGAYSHACIYDTTDLAVTDAEYAQMSLAFDGAQLYDRIPVRQLIEDYNRLCVQDAAQELSYQAAASLPFIPLIAQPDKYSNMDLPRGAHVRVDIDSGTKTSARYLYRMIEELDEGKGRDAMLRLGYDPNTAKMEVVTDDKAAPSGSATRVARHNRTLPKRLHR